MSDIVLTGRQLEVMELISKGFSNAEIANSLGITHNTVKIHVAKIFERLNVSNRAEASALFGRINSEQSAPKPQVINSTSVLKPRIHITLFSSSEHGKIEPRWLKKFSKYLGAWELINLHVPLLNSDFMPRTNSHSDYIIEFEKNENDDITEFSWHIKYYDQERNEFRDVQTFERQQENLNTSTLIDIATLTYKELIKDVSQFENLPNQLLQDASEFCGAIHNYYQQDPALLPMIVKICDKIIKTQPEWPIPRALKALTLYRMLVTSQIEASAENFELIANLAKKAYALDVKSAWTHTAFGYYCIINKNLDLAEKHLESALALNPSFFSATQMLVQIYSFNDKFDEAIALSERWLKNHSDVVTVSSVYSSMAIVKYCAQDFDGCKQACQSALMYEGVSKPPLLMLLLSVAEIQNDQPALEKYLATASSLANEESQMEALVTYAKNVVPEKHFNRFAKSLSRAGLKLEAIS